ncbi:hypothetical protein [Haloactinomyces albus]|uniref:Phosphoglycerate dehydrogenase-like enzyme n=1 Tax=Haloactinomyces albus TaxID=1352928 RepID=A0AAE3ZGB8_9ACTN|nr:hypothetical protein [Haloactinomyces albus]MDR7303525.1 phosphoglycerate dehydrogenase-like enzyme [Haloactinomyces albus]
MTTAAPSGRPKALLLTELRVTDTEVAGLLPDDVTSRATTAGEVSPELLKDVVVVVLRSGPEVRARELSLLPALRSVVRPGSGIDDIDLKALDERQIDLYRDQDTSSAAVAEMATLALTSLCRSMVVGHNLVMRGVWAKDKLMGEPVDELAVCVRGAGPVGRSVSRALRTVG